MNQYQLRQVGADVEVFLKDSKGNPVPVCGLLGGTKEFPKKLWEHHGDDYSAVQEDNVMPEFNIMPASDPLAFSEHVTNVYKWLEAYFRNKNLFVDISASREFLPEQLQSEQAKVVGCSPDFNAWSTQMNPLLDPSILGNIRTAGGHVHVSFYINHNSIVNVPDPEAHQCRVIRMMDLTLGVPSVLLDGNTQRKQFYGKAGAHRLKDYGVEYRVLSNFWIANKELRRWIWQNTSLAITLINNQWLHGNNGTLPKEDCTNVIRCINEQDTVLARELIAKWSIPCPN
jgi:hypothetical protein